MGSRALSGWVGSLALALAVLPGCTCSRGDREAPAEAGKDFGDTRAPAPDAAPYLALARSILDASPTSTPAPAPPPAPGRRVVLAFYRADGDTVVATANAPVLSDAVAGAARDLATRVKPDAPGRLELDVATGVSGGDFDQDEDVPLTSVGLDGFFVTQDDGKSAAVTPGEIVQKHLFRTGQTNSITRDKLWSLLASRAGVTEPAIRNMRAYRFRADAHVESVGHDAALPVLRGMVQGPAEVTPERLLAAVRHGADYLARMTSAAGRFVYMYRAAEDKDETTYGWLRHSGTTYALLEAYGELGTPLYLEKSELALKYLSEHLKDDPGSQGKYILDSFDEEQQKAGGAGIALVAFAEHAAVTGKRDWLETMRALARFLVKQQLEDGHFRANVDVEDPGKKRKREVIYYQGEATLGLLRLYAIDPREEYIDAAKRSGDWVVHVRDALVSEDNQEHDHWMSYALAELYRVTRDRAYLEHGYKIARAIQKKQRSAADSPAPDLVSTFYSGMTTPASTRLEAYAADIAAARFAGEPDAWLLDPARDVARSILGQQYSPDNDYWLKNPVRAEGGVRESLFVSDVEIDYVQHAMSGWLHLARELRDPAYGKTGVPSQDPVKSAP